VVELHLIREVAARIADWCFDLLGKGVLECKFNLINDGSHALVRSSAPCIWPYLDVSLHQSWSAELGDVEPVWHLQLCLMSPCKAGTFDLRLFAVC
jgi:hypothetical protein